MATLRELSFILRKITRIFKKEEKNKILFRIYEKL